MRDVYSAVADPTRRQLLRMLADARAGAHTSTPTPTPAPISLDTASDPTAHAGELPLHELVAPFAMGRTAVAKHLAILKEAGLVVDRRVGRETRYRFNPAPLRELQEWVASYEQFWIGQLDQLKALLEDPEHADE